MSKLVLLIVFAGVLVFAGCQQQEKQTETPTQPSRQTQSQGEATEVEPKTVHEVTIIGTEFSFSPSTITVKAGETVRLTFKNEGEVPHNWKIKGMDIGTKTVGTEQSDTIEFTAPQEVGAYPLVAYCSIPGHRESGMEGSLIIE